MVSGLGKTLGIVGFAAGFAFPGAFLGAAAGTAGAARLSSSPRTHPHQLRCNAYGRIS